MTFAFEHGDQDSRRTPVRASRYATCERPHRARYAVKNGTYNRVQQLNPREK